MGYKLTEGKRLEADTAEQRQLAVIAECREAGFSWEGIAAEMNRLGHTNRAGRPWTLHNIRRVYMTATKHGTIAATL